MLMQMLMTVLGSLGKWCLIRFCFSVNSNPPTSISALKHRSGVDTDLLFPQGKASASKLSQSETRIRSAQTIVVDRASLLLSDPCCRMVRLGLYVGTDPVAKEILARNGWAPAFWTFFHVENSFSNTGYSLFFDNYIQWDTDAYVLMNNSSSLSVATLPSPFPCI